MRCEIIAVGTELLLGQIVDTNSAWMGEQLALAGIDSHFQTRVGDNHERMVSALRLALGRARRGHPVRGARPHPGRHHPRRDRRGDGRRPRPRRVRGGPPSRVLPGAGPRHAAQQPPAGRRSGRGEPHPPDAGDRPRPRLPLRREGHLRRAGRALRDAHHAGGRGPAGSEAPRRGRLRHPEPHPPHLGHVRGAPRRALRGPPRRPRGHRPRHHRLPRERDRGAQGAGDRQGRERGGGSAGPRRRGGAPAAHSRRPRVRGGRRNDGEGRPRSPRGARPHPRRWPSR